MQKLFQHVLDVYVENGIYCPRRFTEKQTAALTALNPQFGVNARCSTGVSLKCYTAADAVSFSYSLSYSNNHVGGFDVYENGVLFHNELLSGEDTAEARFIYRKETAGEILLEIVLPGGAEAKLWDIDFGAWRAYDVSREPLVLWYGDSITQATGVTTPSLTFAALASRMAEANYINRGIGSLFYDASVLDEDDPVSPDIIMVEFGSNDLVKRGSDKKIVYIDGEAQYCTENDVPELMEYAREYLEKLKSIYPKAKICVMSMLWEYQTEGDSPLRAAAAYHLALEKLVKELSLTFIHGLTVMPHLKQCCLSDRIHLSVIGCMAAAQSLVRYLK